MNTEKFQYPVPTTASVWEQQIDWMHEHIGVNGEDWDYYKTQFWFKTEQDRILFVLRWA